MITNASIIYHHIMGCDVPNLYLDFQISSWIVIFYRKKQLYGEL